MIGVFLEKSIYAFNLSFLCNSFLNAQDFRDIKWDMTQQQVIDKEKEGVPIESILNGAISYRFKTRNISLYSSLDISYIFNYTTVDSLTVLGLASILLCYNHASSDLFSDIKNLQCWDCGNPIKQNHRYYWRSKDKTYVVELSFDPQKDCVYKIIAKPGYKLMKDIDFSKGQ